MSASKQNDDVELEVEPTAIIDGLTIALVETGARYEVTVDPTDEQTLALEPEKYGEITEVSAGDLYDKLYVEGMYYVPEYTAPWQVNEALGQLADSPGASPEDTQQE